MLFQLKMCQIACRDKETTEVPWSRLQHLVLNLLVLEQFVRIRRIINPQLRRIFIPPFNFPMKWKWVLSKSRRLNSWQFIPVHLILIWGRTGEDFALFFFFNPQSLVIKQQRVDNLPEVKKECPLTVSTS